ncbi:serine protease inhibitor 42Dd-like [Drosophila biarmipes]|uniref:serine protease inhibitor 42Dd-like n=1 Tax=Drosophila biarmipes TaxID=125945 RepID=UPI0007E68C4D|nr:serine protease inhibitor 42Dd-like [Drosophila biarmipes]
MKFLFMVLLATSVKGLFTDDFYKHLAKENANKNIISSPLSVDIIFSMVYMSAGGKTAQEMRDVLKLPADNKEVARKYKDLLTNLEGREKIAILDLANRIYVNERYTINPKFKQVVRDSFKAEAEAIRLSDPGKAASIVNKWVNDATRRRIKTIVRSQDMNSDLTMVLLNAIYFKGQWQQEFNPTFTKVADFRTADNKVVPVQMMRLSGKFKAAFNRELGVKIIQLPYRNSSLFMVIYLPEKADGLQELERRIADLKLPLSEIKVDLRLPKFKIEFSSDLKNILMKMGIRDAFTSRADFGGLVTPSAGKISKVIHKAFIEVNEEGAEAAAVTDLGIYPILRKIPLYINVDHPFAYVIRDNETIYLQGHFVNPKE